MKMMQRHDGRGEERVEHEHEHDSIMQGRDRARKKIQRRGERRRNPGCGCHSQGPQRLYYFFIIRFFPALAALLAYPLPALVPTHDTALPVAREDPLRVVSLVLLANHTAPITGPIIRDTQDLPHRNRRVEVDRLNAKLLEPLQALLLLALRGDLDYGHRVVRDAFTQVAPQLGHAFPLGRLGGGWLGCGGRIGTRHGLDEYWRL